MMKNSQKGSVVILLSIIIILLVIVFGIYIYTQNRPTQTVVVSPSQTETPSQSSVTVPTTPSVTGISNTTTQGSITLTSPSAGTQWKIGTTHTISWNPGLVYDVGCHNSVALQNTKGQTVGIISNGLLSQGQNSLSWNTKDLLSSSCGTGAQSITVTPGTYRIAVMEQGNGGPSMPDINAYSNYFSIIQ